MTLQGKRGGVSLLERRNSRGKRSDESSGIVSRISDSKSVARGRQAASEASSVAKKLLQSNGKTTWIAKTTFLILVVPLIIEMGRKPQMVELELQHASLLGMPSHK